MASATLARAASFSSGATESSRSRKLMSAGTVGALAKKRSFDPGEDMHERRGRLRERSDMQAMVGRDRDRPKTGTATRMPPRRRWRSAVASTGYGTRWRDRHTQGRTQQ